MNIVPMVYFSIVMMQREKEDLTNIIFLYSSTLEILGSLWMQMEVQRRSYEPLEVRDIGSFSASIHCTRLYYAIDKSELKMSH